MPVPYPVQPINVSRRVDALGKGPREIAGQRSVAPAHLTDIEKGGNPPSGEPLRLATQHGLPIPDLRFDWSKPNAVAKEIVSNNPTPAAKVPDLHGTGRTYSPARWNRPIHSADHLAARFLVPASGVAWILLQFCAMGGRSTEAPRKGPPKGSPRCERFAQSVLAMLRTARHVSHSAAWFGVEELVVPLYSTMTLLLHPPWRLART
jgi:hypothetical protein